MTAGPFLDFAYAATETLLAAAFLLTLFRLARGPSLADRVVALDLMSVLSVGILAVFAITRKEPVFLDVAIVVAVMTFLATVGFGYFIERGATGARGQTEALDRGDSDA